MAEQRYRIVPATESELHDEPHISGSRITVRSIHARVEEAGLSPETVADRYNLDLADVYRALAYYHDNPEEMRRVARERDRIVEDHRGGATTGPDDL